MKKKSLFHSTLKILMVVTILLLNTNVVVISTIAFKESHDLQKLETVGSLKIKRTDALIGSVSTNNILFTYNKYRISA